jgi:hypothetical protein
MKKGRRPDIYQPGAEPQGNRRVYCSRAEGPIYKLLWVGPSALPFLPAIILGRCPRLVWIALSALAAKQLPYFLTAKHTIGFTLQPIQDRS